MDKQNEIMAIRECCMEFFKGTCGERFANHGRLVLLQNPPVITVSDNMYEARRQYEVRTPMLIAYDGKPILSMAHHPDIVQFHAKGELLAQLREFFDTYLPGVEIKEGEENAETN